MVSIRYADSAVARHTRRRRRRNHRNRNHVVGKLDRRGRDRPDRRGDARTHRWRVLLPQELLHVQGTLLQAALLLRSSTCHTNESESASKQESRSRGADAYELGVVVALPVVCRVELREAQSDGRPQGQGRDPHRRSSQDRIPVRFEAAALWRHGHRHDPIPSRLVRSLRQGSGTLRHVARPRSPI